MTTVKVRVQIAKSELLDSLGEYLERCRDGELARHDAERLEGFARNIRERLNGDVNHDSSPWETTREAG